MGGKLLSELSDPLKPPWTESPGLPLEWATFDISTATKFLLFEDGFHQVAGTVHVDAILYR
jgi:hypothetical protein